MTANATAAASTSRTYFMNGDTITITFDHNVGGQAASNDTTVATAAITDDNEVTVTIKNAGAIPTTVNLSGLIIDDLASNQVDGEDTWDLTLNANGTASVNAH